MQVCWVKGYYLVARVACGLLDYVDHPTRSRQGSKLYKSLFELKTIIKSKSHIFGLVIDRINFASQTKHGKVIMQTSYIGD